MEHTLIVAHPPDEAQTGALLPRIRGRPWLGLRGSTHSGHVANVVVAESHNWRRLLRREVK